MRKSRTSMPILRSLRLGAAVFVGWLAVWLMWLVGDPAAALRELGEMVDTARVAMVHPEGFFNSSQLGNQAFVPVDPGVFELLT